MRPATLSLAIALTTAPGFAAEPPSLAWGPQGLSLARLPPILADAEVSRHLGTGLTTTLLVTVEASGAASFKGGAQANVRYDLWDEIYLVEILDARASAAATLRSRDELHRWWASLVLLAAAQARPSSGSTRARVTLQVLPFSQAEQKDAQEWLLRSLRASHPPSAASPPGAPAPAPAPAPVRDFYGAMLASSIGRRSLITYSWTVPIGAPR
jgi:hypothetical protein